MNEPIGLSGLRERRIATIDQRLRDQRDDRHVGCRGASSALPSAFWNMKPIAPCVSPTAYCTGTVGTWPSAISERRRMKPTCGPLPCVSTTFQPAPIMVDHVRGGRAHGVVLVGERHVLVVADQRVAADGDHREWLGHGALDASRSMRPCGVSTSTHLLVRERLHRRREARHRRGGDAGADLPDARLAVRDAAVDDRQHAAVDHLARVDAGGGGGEVERAAA